MKSTFLLGAALCSSVGAVSLAAVTPIRRDSSLKLVLWSPFDNSLLFPLVTTSNFDPFEASYDSDTMQFSSVSTTGATYSGSSAAQSEGDPASGSFTLSTFRYTFEVTSTISFQLDGSLQSTFSGQTLLTLRNTGVIPTRTVSAASSTPFGATEVHWTGELERGTYLLTLDEGNATHVDAPPGTRTACNFVLTFTAIACSGDFNFDSVVDDADFQHLVVAYDLLDCQAPEMPAGCPSDLNHDGFVEDADFVLFVAAYDALLCP